MRSDELGGKKVGERSEEMRMLKSVGRLICSLQLLYRNLQVLKWDSHIRHKPDNDNHVNQSRIRFEERNERTRE